MRHLDYTVVAGAIRKDAHLAAYGVAALDPYVLRSMSRNVTWSSASILALWHVEPGGKECTPDRRVGSWQQAGRCASGQVHLQQTSEHVLGVERERPAVGCVHGPVQALVRLGEPGGA